jgi:hypothetical protein
MIVRYSLNLFVNTGVSHFSYLLLLPAISSCTTTKVLKNKTNNKGKKQQIATEN